MIESVEITRIRRSPGVVEGEGSKKCSLSMELNGERKKCEVDLLCFLNKLSTRVF